MSDSKDFIRQRIAIYAGADIDPDDDDQVKVMLQQKFNIFLPQRASFTDALSDAISDHEIISLLVKYRTL